ncbi:MAG: hypothetical protein OEV08_07365 [Nitrospira sp.]|nr:hypothetical protein [Nitrospira sp.]
MTIYQPSIMLNSKVATWIGITSWLLLCTALLLWSPSFATAKSKHKHKAPRHEPELKILEVTLSPNPYTASSGSLEFSALLQLPKKLEEPTILEVTSLITSPSKSSLRFLSTRTTLEPHQAPTDGSSPPNISVMLTWDGLDQHKTTAGAGLYHFEVKAKLLTNGEKGPRTQMVGWPKRGTIEVK